jgi:hypothetical protein
MSLAAVIQQVRANVGHRDEWLLIHGDPIHLSLSTDCALSRVEIDEDSEDFDEILPAEYVQRGLVSTIDYETLQQCVNWADQLACQQDDETAARFIRYFLRFGACPNTLGAPDPPTLDERRLESDRNFFEALGPEREGTQCKHWSCARGTVKFSVFCAIHHFESVRKRPCPFANE